MAADRHPGITMHKLSFGGGFVGLLFAGGSALIFVLGFPTLWYFVAFAAALGVGIAAFLSLIRPHIEHRNRPLSILRTSENTASPGAQKVGRRDAFRLLPKPVSA